MPQPFTEEGVAALIGGLYDLTDYELGLQADAAKEDFRSWIGSHLILDDDQVVYLENMPEDWMELTGNDFSFALRNRFEISLIKPVEISPKDYSSKIIRSDMDIVRVFNLDLGMQTSGSMDFHVEVPKS